MKKSLLTIAIVATALTAATAAYAQDANGQAVSNAKSGWYLDGDLGVSRANDRSVYNDTNYTGALTGGYRWAVSPDMSIGAELGYVYLGKLDAREGAKFAYWANGGQGQTRSNTRGATLGAAMRVNLNPAWYLNFRAGAFDARSSGLSDDSLMPVRRNFNNNLGYYAGVGTGWDINQNWSVGVNYNYYQVSRDPSTINGQRVGTRYNLDTNTLTASAEYRF